MKLTLTNPFDQSVVCEVPYHDDRAIETLLEESRACFWGWRRTSLDERITRVSQGLDAFLAQKEDVAKEISQQMGKPIGQARGEVDTMIDRARQSIALAKDALATEELPVKDGFIRRIEHTPLGVVLDIAAWNYPLLIPINVIVPALLAGNVVILKHSAKTPLCGARFEACFDGLVRHVILSHAATAKLIGDARVAHVSFTGSVDGGHHIYRAVAATRFIDVGLELGGKDPAYVAEDADLSFAVENIVDGACFNAGQSCCGIERVYVHQSLYGEFVERARTIMEKYVLGDPMAESTTMGPLAGRSASAFLQSQVEDAKSRGATLLLGGHSLTGSAGNFFLPTLLKDVPNDADIMQEESFGPTLPVACVDSDEQALALMEDSRFGLTASVWTSDQQRAERLAQNLSAGTVYQNRCDFLDPAQPWTGTGDSGKGSTLSRYGFFHLTRRKSLHFRIRT